jgi:hypothetical protein
MLVCAVLTVSLTELEVTGIKFESPLYRAETWCVPELKDV